MSIFHIYHLFSLSALNIVWLSLEYKTSCGAFLHCDLFVRSNKVCVTYKCVHKSVDCVFLVRPLLYHLLYLYQTFCAAHRAGEWTPLSIVRTSTIQIRQRTTASAAVTYRSAREGSVQCLTHAGRVWWSQRDIVIFCAFLKRDPVRGRCLTHRHDVLAVFRLVFHHGDFRHERLQHDKNANEPKDVDPISNGYG